MRLQKQLNRVVAGKEYGKYLLVIPPEAVQELRWKEGEELDHKVRDQALIVRKAESLEEEATEIASKYVRKPKHR